MAIELVKEKYIGAINTVEIGGGKLKPIMVGGQTSLPLLIDEGNFPNRPLVALEMYDCRPGDWPDHIIQAYNDDMSDPVAWAKKCVSIFGAKVLCVRMMSVHPDYGSGSSDEALARLKAIYVAARVPLIIIGSGDDDRDNELMPKVSKALAGENCLIGVATQNNYKSLAAACVTDGHSIIAQSPIDINIAKQMNILISDMGLDTKKIVMDPTTTSLGYGMEYVYSIMERARLAAFSGDKMLAMPFIVFVGQESWKTKEAKDFGAVQGINWEIATAVSLVQSGADILVMRHPDSAKAINKYLDMINTGGVK